MENSLITIAVEAARAIITTYAVYSIIVGGLGSFFKLRLNWMEGIEALGGMLWVIGSSLWRFGPDTPGYDWDLFARSVGIALMLFPRVVVISLHAFEVKR